MFHPCHISLIFSPSNSFQKGVKVMLIHFAESFPLDQKTHQGWLSDHITGAHLVLKLYFYLPFWKSLEQCRPVFPKEGRQEDGFKDSRAQPWKWTHIEPTNATELLPFLATSSLSFAWRDPRRWTKEQSVTHGGVPFWPRDSGHLSGFPTQTTQLFVFHLHPSNCPCWLIRSLKVSIIVLKREWVSDRNKCLWTCLFY